MWRSCPTLLSLVGFCLPLLSPQESPSGVLRVKTDVSAVRVLLDGVEAGETPFRREMPAGKYRLALAKDGYELAEQGVDVAPGRTTNLFVVMKPLPAGLTVEFAPKGTKPGAGQVSLGPLRTFEVVAVTKAEAPVAAVEADRVLLVHIRTFGALVGTQVPDDLLIDGAVALIDRTTGRELFNKGFVEKTSVGGKLDALQADNQKGLKEKLNKLVEQFCVKAVAELKKARM
jgi:hypothetical protein